MNAGHGFKCFSEEGSEACNKLIRRYREHIPERPASKNIFTESDPILVEYRSKLICDKCGEHGHTKRTKCCNYDSVIDSSIDSLVQSLLI